MALDRPATDLTGSVHFTVRPTVLVALGDYGVRAAGIVSSILDDIHPVVARSVATVAVTGDGPTLLAHIRHASEQALASPPTDADELAAWVTAQTSALVDRLCEAAGRASGAAGPALLQQTRYGSRLGYDTYVVGDLTDPLCRMLLDPTIDGLAGSLRVLPRQPVVPPRRTILLGIDLAGDLTDPRAALTALRARLVQTLAGTEASTQADSVSPERDDGPDDGHDGHDDAHDGPGSVADPDTYTGPPWRDRVYLVDRTDEDGHPLDPIGEESRLLSADAIGGFLGLLLGSGLRNAEEYLTVAYKSGPTGDRNEGSLSTLAYHADVWPLGPVRRYAARRLAARVLGQELLGESTVESGNGRDEARRLWRDARRDLMLGGPELTDYLRRNANGEPIAFAMDPEWLHGFDDDQIGDRIVVWEVIADGRLRDVELVQLKQRQESRLRMSIAWLEDSVGSLLQEQLVGVRTVRPLLAEMKHWLEFELARAKAGQGRGCLTYILLGPILRARVEASGDAVQRRRQALDAALRARPDYRAYWLRMLLTWFLLAWTGWLLSPYLSEEARLLNAWPLQPLFTGGWFGGLVWLLVGVLGTVSSGLLGLLLAQHRVDRARRRLIQAVEQRLSVAFLDRVADERYLLYQRLLGRVESLRADVDTWLAGLQGMVADLDPDDRPEPPPSRLERPVGHVPPLRARYVEAVEGGGVDVVALAWELLQQRLMTDWRTWDPETVRAHALDIVSVRLGPVFHDLGLPAMLFQGAAGDSPTAVTPAVRRHAEDLHDRTRPLLRVATRGVNVGRVHFLGVTALAPAKYAGLDSHADWSVIETGDPTRLPYVTIVAGIPWAAAGVR